MALRLGTRFFKKTKLTHVIPTLHQTNDKAAMDINLPNIAVKPHRNTQICRSTYALETGFNAWYQSEEIRFKEFVYFCAQVKNLNLKLMFKTLKL